MLFFSDLPSNSAPTAQLIMDTICKAMREHSSSEKDPANTIGYCVATADQPLFKQMLLMRYLTPEGDLNPDHEGKIPQQGMLHVFMAIQDVLSFCAWD